MSDHNIERARHPRGHWPTWSGLGSRRFFLLLHALPCLIFASALRLHAASSAGGSPPAPQVFDLHGRRANATRTEETYRDNPDIVVYLPREENNTGTALIVFPGGGYMGHDMAHHVEDNARLFVPKGIAVIGVRYRIVPRGAEMTANAVGNALVDVQQAVRLVRSRASEWHLDLHRIGVLGYSAGGHLALTLACHFDSGYPESQDPILRQSCRPDFMAVLCPWPRVEQVTDFHFDPRTPPTFIASAEDDQVAPSEFAVGLARALGRLSVSVELNLYPSGGHMAFHFDQATEASTWPARFLPWLESLNSKHSSR